MTVSSARLVNGLRSAGPRILHAAVTETASQAQRHPFVPHDKGQLRGSIRRDAGIRLAGTRSIGTIRAPVIQASTTEYGARAHVIRPRNAPRLVFFWPKVGRVVALKKVDHPGNLPMPWWRDVVTQSFEQALPIAARRVFPQ